MPITSVAAHKKPLDTIETAKRDWKDAWYSDYNWIQFNAEVGRVFYKVCREKQEKNKKKMFLLMLDL
jgi:hypothetical protein